MGEETPKRMDPSNVCCLTEYGIAPAGLCVKMPKISPINYKDFEKFVKFVGCEFVRQKGSHRVFTRSDLNRPIIIPAHKKDLPVFIIRQIIRQLNLSVEDYLEILSKI